MRTIAGLTLLFLALSATACSDDEGADAPVSVKCDGSFLDVPEDPGARGPWPVGARTVTVAGYRAEIWYPAEVGSESGKEEVQYDLREHLPDDDQGKIPDADAPMQPCDCYRDLPFDGAHGPYPPVLFLHGTASFRSQSASQMTHWASRGFVVVAADHPQLELRDALELKLGADQAGDAKKLLAALDAPSGDIEFLAGKIASDRKAVVGYSAGGRALKDLGAEPGVRVLIPIAAAGVRGAPGLLSTLIVGAMDDTVSPYADQQRGYAASPSVKRLVGLSSAEHLLLTDLCGLARDRGNLVQVAIEHGVEISPLVIELTRDGCNGSLPPERASAILSYATAAALEEQLYCKPASAAALSSLRDTFPEVGDYQESR